MYVLYFLCCFHIRKVFPLCDWETILNSYHFRYRLTWCWIKSMISMLFVFINLIILLNTVVVDSQTFKNLQIQLQIYLGSLCIRTWGPLSHGIHILWLVEKPEMIQNYFTLDHRGPKNGWKKVHDVLHGSKWELCDGLPDITVEGAKHQHPAQKQHIYTPPSCEDFTTLQTP